jgi:signal peptidase I
MLFPDLIKVHTSLSTFADKIIIIENMAKAIFLALAAAVLIKLFLLDLIIAEGDSMEPSIQSGKVLVVNRLRYGIRFPWQQGYLLRWGIPKEGDIVVFYAPTGGIAVKRCGTAGKGEFLVQGDNSLQSYDSRSYGPISADNTIGKVLGIK